MRLHLDRLTLSVRPDGSWLGYAEAVIDGQQWSGELAIGYRAMDVLRKAVAEVDGRRRKVLQRKTDVRRTRRETGLCMSCPAKSKQWRCPECAAKFREWRKRREERQSA